MDRISINLLPPELKLSKKKEQKKQWAMRVSVGVLVGMILATSSLIAVSVVQSALLSSEERKLENLKNQVATYKEAEGIASLLRNRLTGILQANQKKYPQTEAFIMLTKLTPEEVNLFAFKVDKSLKASLQGQTNSPARLEEYFTNLTDPKVNEAKINRVTVNNLNKGVAETIRFDLDVTAKGI